MDPDVVKPWQDDEVTTVFDIGAHRDAKLAALAEHATQLTVHRELSSFSLSNKAVTPVPGEEHFMRAPLPRAPSSAARGREDHLLTGLGVG